MQHNKVFVYGSRLCLRESPTKLVVGEAAAAAAAGAASTELSGVRYYYYYQLLPWLLGLLGVMS